MRRQSLWLTVCGLLALALPTLYIGTERALVYLSQKPGEPVHVSELVPTRKSKPQQSPDAPKHNGDDHYDGGPGIDTIAFANARQPPYR
jgi:hypothetical protein